MLELEKEVFDQWEADFLREVDSGTQHGFGMVVEAIALGFEMGQNGVEISLLKDGPTKEAIKREVQPDYYIGQARYELTRFLIKLLAVFVESPSSVVSSQTVKELALGAACLGDAMNRNHIIP